MEMPIVEAREQEGHSLVVIEQRMFRSRWELPDLDPRQELALLARAL